MPLRYIHLPLLVLVFLPGLLVGQGASVHFRVNMSYLIEQGLFDPQAETPDVAGNFNGWGNPGDVLTDMDGDSIFEVTLSGFLAGQTIEFKFRKSSAWDNTEEFPGGGSNRSAILNSGLNTLEYWYNDEQPGGGGVVAEFVSTSQRLYSGSLIVYEATPSAAVEEWSWTFEGATPEQVDGAAAAVAYHTPGTYDVQLIATGGGVSDTLLKADYIQVDARQTDQLHWWNEGVFYEIFVRSFYDSDDDGIGDFKGLTEKLDYLNDGDPDTDSDLGVTGIWLMPIHPSPSYHGYDVTDYRGINPDYGTMDDFREFLEAAHDRGIRVIIDLVLNHSSSQHPWFQQSAQGDPHFREFYRWSDTKPNYQGPWGQEVWHQSGGDYYYGIFWGGMPDINYNYQPAVDSLFAIMEFWLEDVGVDGFRLDAVKHLFEDGPIQENVPATFDFLQDFRSVLKAANSEAFAVGEVWSSIDLVLPYVTDGRLDYCFEFDMAGASLGAAANGSFLPATFRMLNTYNQYPHLQFGTFLANHDQNRVLSSLGGDVEKAKRAASIYLTMPGIPYLYYGEEIGMTGVKPEDINVRTPMQWTAGAHAGFSGSTPWEAPNSNYSSYNVATADADTNSLLHHYRKLIQTRNEQPALHCGQFQPLFSLDERLLAFWRWHDGDTLLVVAKLSDEPITDVSLLQFAPFLEPGTYTVEDLWWGGTQSIDVGSDYSIELPAGEDFQVALFRLQQATSTLVEPRKPSLQLFLPYPNPVRDEMTVHFILPNAGRGRLSVYDLWGREVAVIREGRLSSGEHSTQWRPQGLPAGMYTLRLRVGNEIQSRSFQLQR